MDTSWEDELPPGTVLPPYFPPPDPDREILLWLDMETTGLDPQRDRVLQVAYIITDPLGNLLKPPIETKIRHPEGKALRQMASPLVQRMHDKTGLWARLDNQEANAPLHLLDGLILKEIQEYARDNRERIRLAGNSIRLDLNFMAVHMPKTYGHLHYKSLDVSALAYACDAWGIVDDPYPKRKTHNALDDIIESLAEYQWIMDKLKEQKMGRAAYRSSHVVAVTPPPVQDSRKK